MIELKIKKILCFFIFVGMIFAENSDMKDVKKAGDSESITIAKLKLEKLQKETKQEKLDLELRIKDLSSIKNVSEKRLLELDLLQKENAELFEKEWRKLTEESDKIKLLKEVFHEEIASDLQKFCSQKSVGIDAVLWKKDGSFVKGKIIKYGPIIFSEFGVVSEKNGKFYLIEEKDFGTKSDSFEIYFSSDDALKTWNKKESSGFWGYVERGKGWALPILFLGILAFFITLWRVLFLQNVVKEIEESTVIKIVEMVKNGENDLAINLSENFSKPLDVVLKEGILHAGCSKEFLEEIMFEKIAMSAPKLEKGLAVLAVIGTISPLLGLLGTVSGMISSFEMLTDFSGETSQLLSSGISEALITTELGLCVAIPTLIFHAFLAKKVKNALNFTQKSALIFVNHLKIRK